MVQRDFEDYVTESQQLEKEYEVTIEQNEKKISELKTTNMKLQNEIDSLRVSRSVILLWESRLERYVFSRIDLMNF